MPVLSCPCLSCHPHGQTGSLGHGTFGIVIKALDLRSEPPTEVAIKLLPRGDFVGPLTLTAVTAHLQPVMEQLFMCRVLQSCYTPAVSELWLSWGPVA